MINEKQRKYLWIVVFFRFEWSLVVSHTKKSFCGLSNTEGATRLPFRHNPTSSMHHYDSSDLFLLFSRQMHVRHMDFVQIFLRSLLTFALSNHLLLMSHARMSHKSFESLDLLPYICPPPPRSTLALIDLPSIPLTNSIFLARRPHAPHSTSMCSTYRHRKWQI
jgi:hypothetical protein